MAVFVTGDLHGSLDIQKLRDWEADEKHVVLYDNIVALGAGGVPARAPGTGGTTPLGAAWSTATPAAGGAGATSTSPAASASSTARPAPARPATC